MTVILNKKKTKAEDAGKEVSGHSDLKKNRHFAILQSLSFINKANHVRPLLYFVFNIYLH